MSFERFHAGEPAWVEEPALDQLGGPLAPADGDVARILAEIEELEQGRLPVGLHEHRFYALLRDLRSFTEQWLDLALGGGWPLQDLYGSPPELHHRRLDLTGAVLLLDGRPVLSIDANRVVIGNANQDPHVFYRRNPAVSVPFDRSRAHLIWDVLRRSRNATVRW